MRPTHTHPSTNQLIVVIVVSGGLPEVGTSVEAYNADGTRLCRLPNLPSSGEHRVDHSMSGSIICGGYDTPKSCIKFQNGAWKTMPFSLQEKRADHVSWTRSDGKFRLIGGRYSSSTSELVSESGSITGFALKYSTR